MNHDDLSNGAPDAPTNEELAANKADAGDDFKAQDRGGELTPEVLAEIQARREAAAAAIERSAFAGLNTGEAKGELLGHAGQASSEDTPAISTAASLRGCLDWTSRLKADIQAVPDSHQHALAVRHLKVAIDHLRAAHTALSSGEGV